MAEEVKAYESPLAARPAKAGTASVRDLAGDLVYQLPGCPDLAIRKELARAWREFAERTSCWRGRALVALVAGERTYAAPCPFGAVVRSVDGVALVQRGEDGNPDTAHPILPLRPWHFDFSGDTVVVLLDAPAEEDVARTPWMAVSATYIPERDSEDVPKPLLDRWGNALAACALWRLASQDGRAWANAAIAARAFSEWKDALNEASIRAIAPDGEIRATNWEGWA